METKTCVLSIEDDPLQRQFIREYLEIESRHRVLEAKGIYHALALCECAHPAVDVVLIDMAMTRIDPVELILMIRKKRPDVAILGMTDRPTEFYEKPRLRSAHVSFIPPPLTPARLNRGIEAMIRAQERKAKSVLLGHGRSLRIPVYLPARSSRHG